MFHNRIWWFNHGHRQECVPARCAHLRERLVQGAFLTAGRRSCWRPYPSRAGQWAGRGRPPRLRPASRCGASGTGVRRAVRSRRTARHCECRVPLPRRSPAGGGPVPGFPQRFEHPLLWDSLSEHSAFRARLNFPSPSEASAPYIHGFAPPQSTAVSSALYLTPSTKGKRNAIATLSISSSPGRWIKYKQASEVCPRNSRPLHDAGNCLSSATLTCRPALGAEPGGEFSTPRRPQADVLSQLSIFVNKRE